MYVCAFVRVCELLNEMQWGEPLYLNDVKQFGAKRYHKLKLESFEGAVTLVVWVCIGNAASFGWMFFLIVLYDFYLFVC